MDEDVELTVPAARVGFQWIGATPGVSVAHVRVPRDLVRLVAAELEVNGEPVRTD